jgi:hypothetical protein
LKEKRLKLHGSAIVYHQPRRLLLKNLLVTLDSFDFSNHHKEKLSLQRNLNNASIAG